MRFKLILSVKADRFGSVLPVSYQYELSSCIYRKLSDNMDLCATWLSQNGFEPRLNARYRLFSLSNFYIPRIRVEEDRLHILARRVQLWISFLPERGTEELLRTIFSGQSLLIGDRYSKVEFTVDDIVRIEAPDYQYTMEYLSLSPLVFSNVHEIGIEYLSPDAPQYCDVMIKSILDKYEYFYHKPFPADELRFGFELITAPKRKGIFIKRYTANESKTIGYMYKFRLTLNPVLQHLIYNTGLGEKINLGFGCIEEHR